MAIFLDFYFFMWIIRLPFLFLELAISRISKKEISTYMFHETKKKKKNRWLESLNVWK